MTLIGRPLRAPVGVFFFGPAMMRLEIESEWLEALIQKCVDSTAAKLREDERLLFSEAEAAAKFGVPRHVLRDERLRGNISGCRVGKRVMYSRRALEQFIEFRETEKKGD